MAADGNLYLARCVLLHLHRHRQYGGSQLVPAAGLRGHSSGDAAVGMERRSASAHRITQREA